MQRHVNELLDLNNAVLKNSGVLEKYNDRDVFVVAKLKEKEDSSYELEIKEVSVDKINVPEDSIPDKSTIYLKAKVVKNNDTFKLDNIEDVLPPENTKQNLKSDRAEPK